MTASVMKVALFLRGGTDKKARFAGYTVMKLGLLMSSRGGGWLRLCATTKNELRGSIPRPRCVWFFTGDF